MTRATAHGRLDRGARPYTPYYCEENVWHLAGAPELPPGEHLVLVITNPRRTCALWCQRAAIAPNEPVFWDYHVILAARGESLTLVYDLDTTLPFPCPWEVYADRTFRPDLPVHADHRPHFRAIEAPEYRARFSSDRAHMKKSGAWLAPPPAWPAILSDSAPVTLQALLDLSRAAPGRVLDLDELSALLGRAAITRTGPGA